jgi:hypothetical protein
MSYLKPKREMDQVKKLVCLFENNLIQYKNNLREIKQASIQKMVTRRFLIANKPCVK